MITAMLVYSSCSQDETNKVNTEQTTLTEEELVQKYLKEFENKYEHPLDAIVKEEVLKSENYLNTLDSYAKTKASFILMNNYFEEKNGKKPTYADNFENETYQDYLNRKQTQKAKDQWTNSPKRGALRLLVEDLDNLTNEEEAFKQSKLTQITNEEWYHTLVISDGYRHIKIEVREPNEEDVDIDKIDVPFSVIEQVPLIEGCESVYNLKEQKECFSNKINEHVMKNFNIALANNLGLEKGVKRIFVSFKIDVNGAVVDVNARAPHPELETEAIRVIKLLPKMVPGIHNGRVVNVPYSLPITFSIK